MVANALGNPETKIRDFVVRRFFRLYPLYWFSLIGSYFIFFGGNVDVGQLLANIAMFPIHLGKEPLMGIYWTLETELVFYLFAIVLFCFGVLRQHIDLVFCVFGLIGLFAGFMFGVVESPTNLSLKSLPLNLCFMMMGVLVHVVHSINFDNGGRGYQTYALIAVVAVALAPSLYSLLNYFSTYSADSLRWALSYPIGVAIFFILMAIRGRFMRPLAGIGAISYSIYLMHPFVLAFMVHFVGDQLIVKSIGLTGAVLLAATATIFVSFASYRFIEFPFVSFSKRITGAT